MIKQQAVYTSTLLCLNNCTLFTSRTAHRAACHYFAYSVIQKWVFTPQDNTLHQYMWNLSWGAVNFTFIGTEMWDALKPSKFTTNHLHDFYKILSICASLYVAFSFLFGDFSW